jgi:hypothetical protein
MSLVILFWCGFLLLLSTLYVGRIAYHAKLQTDLLQDVCRELAEANGHRRR